MFVPVATGLWSRVDDSGEDDGNLVLAAAGYEIVCGGQGVMESFGSVERASGGEIGVADVDDEEGWFLAEGETAG